MENTCELLCVITSHPEESKAEELARHLIETRLAACVQIVPKVRSFFKWEGKLEICEEVIMLCKTTPSSYSELSAEILKLHPYETPEIIAFQADCSLPDYLGWVDKQVKGK